jgi:ribosomal protein S12 methylthiotransferase accessory factor
MAQNGALAEGAAVELVPLVRPTRRLDGVEIVLLNQGSFARVLKRCLEAIGAVVRVSLAGASGRVALACPDGANLSWLESLNRMAHGSAMSWLSVFPFGDGVVVGPVFGAEGAACFRCFELRWLGLSASIALERAYFEHLRISPEVIIHSGNADQIAASVLPLIARNLHSAESARRVSVQRLESGEMSESSLEPSPDCEVCGESLKNASAPQAPACWDGDPRPLTDIAPELQELEGWPCGLARIWKHPDRAIKGRPGPFQIAVARFALPEPEKVEGTQDNWSHGTAIVATDARTLALMEAIERYSGLSAPPASIWGSYRELAPDAILPTELPLFSASEYSRSGFPFAPFNPERRLRWNWGYNLTQKRPVLIPTSAAWYGYDDELLGESSNGVAAHTSRGCALLNGVYELVERDAFMIHWLHRFSPPRISLDHVDDGLCLAAAGCISEAGYTLYVLDLTTDLGIPVVLAAGVHTLGRKPALIIGAGAAIHPCAALGKALRELYSATLAPTESWMLRSPVDPTSVTRLQDHARAYEHPFWLPNASFLWSSSREANWPPPDSHDFGKDDELRLIIERLRERGHDVIGVQLTGHDIARHHLHVVRAIVPGLQPLALGSRARLGGRRLFAAPARMGYKGIAVKIEELNLMPHCFP